MEKKSFLYRLYGHFMTITKHKLTVTKYCFKMGLYKQGILHDLSKYSWIEFSSGVKYYQGDKSPIEAEKRTIGYSNGWLHHKGRNKHHWEYWIDRVPGNDKMIPLPMPFNYLKESICDRVAACKIYQKEKYRDASAYEYFMKSKDRFNMNEQNAKEFEEYLLLIKEKGLDEAFKIIKNIKK